MLTPPIDAHFSSAGNSRHNGASQAFQAVASVAVTVLITAAGFLVIDLQPPVTQASVSAPAPITIQHAHKTVSQPGAIVAAPVESSPDAFFEGAADARAGASASQ